MNESWCAGIDARDAHPLVACSGDLPPPPELVNARSCTPEYNQEGEWRWMYWLYYLESSGKIYECWLRGESYKDKLTMKEVLELASTLPIAGKEFIEGGAVLEKNVEGRWVVLSYEEQKEYLSYAG